MNKTENYGLKNKKFENINTFEECEKISSPNRIFPTELFPTLSFPNNTTRNIFTIKKYLI